MAAVTSPAPSSDDVDMAAVTSPAPSSDDVDMAAVTSPAPSSDDVDMESWRPWTAPAALLTGVVLAAVGGLIVDIPAALFFGVKLNSSSAQLPGGLEIIDTFVQDVAFVAAIVIFAQLGGRTLHAWQLGLRRARLWPALGAVVLTLLGFLVFTAIWAGLLETSTKEELLNQLGANQSTVLLIASAALTCVMAPICEELLFRGYFFAALSNWHGWLLAAVLTGIVFGGVHVGSAPAVDLVPLGALGFALCLLYRFTGSLYPCIAAHALNNSFAFGSLEGWSWWQTLLLILAALFTIALVALTLRRAGVIADPPALAPQALS
jgi:membrane protease YdiL (CAAX protease family)